MKAKFGAIVVDGRGKIGGHVASKNRYGSYFRTKVSPVNPQSADQTAVRASFTTNSQQWRDLTEAQRAAWIAAVDNFKSTNVFGDVKTPSGSNLYQSLNQNLAGIGEAAISVPPTDLSTPNGTAFTAICDDSANTLLLSWTTGAVPAGVTRVVDATPPISPGVSFVKNKYRKITDLPAATATGADVYAAYLAKFGAPVTGQKIALRMKDVSTSTGIASGYYYTTLIVVA